MDTPLSQSCHDKDQVNLLDFFIVLAKNGRKIIYVSLAVTVLTYLYFFLSANTYKATARLLPPQQNFTMIGQLLETLGGGTIPGKTGGGGFGSIGGLLGLRSPSDFYIGLMKSEAILDRVIEQFNLQQVYKIKSLESTRNKLSKQSIFTVGKLDGIITLEVTDTDRERSAALTNAVIDGLDKLLQKLVSQEAGARLVFLEKELGKATINLTQAEEALRTFSEKNSLIQIETQTKGTLDYIARMRAEIDTKEVQMQVLRYQATPRNSETIRLEMELNGLKEKLQAAECNQLPGSDICLTTSKAPTLGMEYIRLYREVKFQEGLYQLYTKMAEIARVDMVKDVAVLQVLVPAKAPEKRSNKRLFPSLIAGFGTFFIMILAILFLEYWQRLKKNEKEARKIAQLGLYLEPYRKFIYRYFPLIRKKSTGGIR